LFSRRYISDVPRTIGSRGHTRRDASFERRDVGIHLEFTWTRLRIPVANGHLMVDTLGTCPSRPCFWLGL